jgi:hypothetical protein
MSRFRRLFHVDQDELAPDRPLIVHDTDREVSLAEGSSLTGFITQIQTISGSTDPFIHTVNAGVLVSRNSTQKGMNELGLVCRQNSKNSLRGGVTLNPFSQPQRSFRQIRLCHYSQHLM